MKKNYLLLVYLFLMTFMLSAQVPIDNLIGKNNRLQVEIIGADKESLLFVEFQDEKTYRFCSPMGGYLWGAGDYKVDGNTIYLSTMKEEEPFSNNLLNELFSSKNKNKYVDFVYDSEAYSFYLKGGYKHGNLLLIGKNAKPTPQGTIYMLGNTKVIKKTGYLVPVENLKVRKAPSTKAETGWLDYSFELMCLRVTGKLNENYEITVESYSEGSSVLLAGMIEQYSAVTYEQQTIDGITAPWYRISFTDNDEGFPRYYWIFGGYIKEIADSNTKEYDSLFIESAVQKGYLKKVK